MPFRQIPLRKRHLRRICAAVIAITMEQLPLPVAGQFEILASLEIAEMPDGCKAVFRKGSSQRVLPGDVMGFFDQYERFYMSSTVGAGAHRLNSRYEAIIARNAAVLKGKRVLDIASHDGRWAFAALKAGALHVTGVEARQELIDNALSNFAHYGIHDGFTFCQGDIFDHLRGQKCDFDVVMCLGFFYHTIRHAELLDLIERTGAKWVIIDTMVTHLSEERTVSADNPRIGRQNPYGIHLMLDPVDNPAMACSDSLARNGSTLVGIPSRAAIRFMAKHFGYTVEEFDWPAYFEKAPVARVKDMLDYDGRQRETFYLARVFHERQS